MAQITKYNIIKITEDALMATLKDSLVRNLTNKLVADFKVTAEVEVRAEVEKLSIKGVETFRDLRGMRDEVKVYCEWAGTKN